MTKLQFKGYWNVLRGKITEKCGQWGGDKNMRELGRAEIIVGKIQQHLGRTQKDEDTLMNRNLS